MLSTNHPGFPEFHTSDSKGPKAEVFHYKWLPLVKNDTYWISGTPVCVGGQLVYSDPVHVHFMYVYMDVWNLAWNCVRLYCYASIPCTSLVYMNMHRNLLVSVCIFVCRFTCTTQTLPCSVFTMNNSYKAHITPAHQTHKSFRKPVAARIQTHILTTPPSKHKSDALNRSTMALGFAGSGRYPILPNSKLRIGTALPLF